MGTLSAQTVIDVARGLMNDTGGVRWEDPLCLQGLNSAARELVIYLPSAYAVAAKPALAAGTRQTLAGLGLADGLQFLDVTRNYSADGNTPGRAITPIDRAYLDEARPDWHTETASAVIQHFTRDSRDPKAIYVYPPSTGTTKVEVIYSAAPSQMTDVADLIPVDDIYANALAYYLLFFIATVNKPGQVSPPMADKWYALFLQSIGVKDQRVRTNYVKDAA